MPDRLKIAVIQRADVKDVRTLSGIPYFELKALQNHVGDVEFIGPDASELTRAIERIGKVLNRLSYSLFRRHISPDHHRFLSWRLGRVFSARLQHRAYDIIFAPNASGELAYLSTDIPIVYYTDVSWADVVNYYSGTSHLFKWAEAEGHKIDEAALLKSSALIFPSHWAASTAVNRYRVAASRVHMIPCGANFDNADIPPREQALQHSLQNGITLLWIGVDWNRKGGSIAYDCLMELLRRGVHARMLVCGCIPPHIFQHPQIEVIPFLDKRDPEQRRRLSQLFLNATFFLFPTMAEAFGIVLCEASAHGLPTLVRRTGGVQGAIADGENGFVMSADAPGTEYADKIMEIVADPVVYQALVFASRRAYEERLNWDAWGQQVKPIFEDLVQKNRESRALSLAKA